MGADIPTAFSIYGLSMIWTFVSPMSSLSLFTPQLGEPERHPRARQNCPISSTHPSPHPLSPSQQPIGHLASPELEHFHWISPSLSTAGCVTLRPHSPSFARLSLNSTTLLDFASLLRIICIAFWTHVL